MGARRSWLTEQLGDAPRPPTADERYTPGVLGYFIGLLVADVTAAILLGAVIVVPQATSAGEWTQVIPAVAFIGVWGLVVVGIPAIPFLVAAHYLVRRQPAQWVHIVVFGLAGGATCFTVLSLLPSVGFATLPAAAAVLGGAIGRASIAGLIRGRRVVEDWSGVLSQEDRERQNSEE